MRAKIEGEGAQVVVHGANWNAADALVRQARARHCSTLCCCSLEAI
jgi:threonine dehydratase